MLRAFVVIDDPQVKYLIQNDQIFPGLGYIHFTMCQSNPLKC